MCYDRRTEALASRRLLRGVSLLDLRRIFGARSDDPMYDAYPIGEDEAAKLRKFVESDFDFTRYLYYLEASTAAAPRPVSADR